MHSTQIERRVIGKHLGPITVETRDDGQRVLVGYGAVFYRAGKEGCEYCLWDNIYERIAPTAFDRALSEKHDARGLFNHNPDNLLGRVANGTMRLSVDTEGLKYEIDLDTTDPDHMRVLRKVERGDLSGSSFSFNPTHVEWIDEGDRELRIIKDLNLYDTGPVTYPAYEGTSVAARAEQLVAEARSEHADWKAEQTRLAAEQTQAAEQSRLAAEQTQAAEDRSIVDGADPEAAAQIVVGVLPPASLETPMVEIPIQQLSATVVEPQAEAPLTLGRQAVPTGEEEAATETEKLAYMKRKLLASTW